MRLGPLTLAISEGSVAYTPRDRAWDNLGQSPLSARKITRSRDSVSVANSLWGEGELNSDKGSNNEGWSGLFRTQGALMPTGYLHALCRGQAGPPGSLLKREWGRSQRCRARKGGSERIECFAQS